MPFKSFDKFLDKFFQLRIRPKADRKCLGLFVRSDTLQTRYGPMTVKQAAIMCAQNSVNSVWDDIGHEMFEDQSEAVQEDIRETISELRVVIPKVVLPQEVTN